MTTKPPPTAIPAPSESIEKIAYESVSSIPTQEPNDRYRLGYHVWLWMTKREGTLEDAINVSGARILIPREEALRTIRVKLSELGVRFSG
jgi:hypothetical protein